MTDLIVWIIAAVMLLLGCWVQTALGFGMALVSAPIIVILKPEWVPVVLSITALQLSAINAWNQRDALQIRDMMVPMFMRIPGTIAGVWVLVLLSTRWLQILVAASVLLAVAISIRSRQFHATPVRLGWAGFASGFMGTTTSIGGPPVALVMQYGQPRTVRANLSLYFTYGCVISITGYAITGILTRQLIVESISFMPCALIGFYWGIQARNYVAGDKFRPFLIGLCTIAAVVVLVSALFRI